ncbi:MAG: trypsin-like peptidase domain-containing protein [Acidobacteria bacterium]|nr:trypsin-like peptidase domain-containing protein [Acidobacteriota bacterium]
MADSVPSRTEYLRRLLEDMPPAVLENAPGFQESVATPELTASALRAAENVRSGTPLTAEHQVVMEAIVVPFLRPVYDILAGTFQPLPAPWELLNTQSQNVNNAIQAIGRLEVGGLPGVPYGGTGFLVAPNLILTNRHVAELVTSSLGIQNLTFIPGRSARLDLKQEIVPSAPVFLTVRSVKMVHPYWDAAILQVDGVPPGLAPLNLASASPDNLAKRTVAVIGYPAMDSRGDIPTQLKMFHGVFQKKRLLPGFTMGFRQIDSYGRTVEALAHDCSTLGGNSGSAVIDPVSGLVLGLHFAGIELQANFAVPAWELARDSRIVDAGIKFDARPAAAPDPQVESVWNLLTTVPAETAPVTVIEGTPYPPDWYEKSTTEEKVEALANNHAAAEAAIRATLTAPRAEQVVRDLTPPAVNEGIFDLFDPPPDPDLPEIVWIHGIMGGHLARPGFLRHRVWLNPAEIVLFNVANDLSLQSDGETALSGRGLESDGMMQLFYMPAEHAWRKSRFVVHNYSYDWRLSIDKLADQLHNFLLTLKQQNPNRRLLIVAHSMGGLVVSMYAQRHPEWRDTIQKAIFMGVPLGGSYCPLQAFIGTYDLLKKLAMVSARVSVDDMRRLAVTLPGLIDMLPNPSIFADAAASYTTGVWPADIPSPRQFWLDHSRNLKSAIAQSPLLERATLLVSLRIPTVGASSFNNGTIHDAPATAAGDGTVPGRAAVLNGLPAFHVDFDHAAIPKDPLAIQAVMDLARTGACSLQPVRPADLDRVFPPQEAPLFQEGAIEATVPPLRERFAARQIRESDIEWLFKPGLTLPPAV